MRRSCYFGTARPRLEQLTPTKPQLCALLHAIATGTRISIGRAAIAENPLFWRDDTLKPTPRGFTLIEMLVVLAMIAILALLAVPHMQGKVIRDQIVEAMPLAELAKKPVAAAWSTAQELPADNEEAGLPSPKKIVSNLVSSVRIEDGAVHVTFGNRANGAIHGKTLTLRPAVVEDAPVVPVAWVCGHAKPPDKMTAQGPDRTNVPPQYLPINCR